MWPVAFAYKHWAFWYNLNTAPVAHRPPGTTKPGQTSPEIILRVHPVNRTGFSLHLLLHKRTKPKYSEY